MKLWLFLALAINLAADSREVIESTFGQFRKVETIYRQDQNSRVEVSDNLSSTPSVTIRTGNVYRHLDPVNREYTEYRSSPVTFAYYLADALGLLPHSGKTVNIYRDVVDTHQRKVLFGRTARHLIVRERVVAEPGACGKSSMSETDGWYINWPHPRDVDKVSVNGFRCEDTVVRHGNEMSLGYAVIEIRKGNEPVIRRVLELSEVPLDSSLFKVPAAFKQVEPESGWRQDLFPPGSVLLSRLFVAI